MLDLEILAKFGASGAFCTLLHFGVVWVAGYCFGVPLAWANGVAYVVANVFSYLIQSRWTFRARPQSMLRWGIASAMLLSLAVVLGRLADLALLPVSIAWMVVTIPIVVVSYALMRFWVFPNSATVESSQ